MNLPRRIPGAQMPAADPPTRIEIRPMTACDARCPAWVQVAVRTAAGWLGFCGHHYRQHEPALAAVTLETVDERTWKP